MLAKKVGKGSMLAAVCAAPILAMSAGTGVSSAADQPSSTSPVSIPSVASLPACDQTDNSSGCDQGNSSGGDQGNSSGIDQGNGSGGDQGNSAVGGQDNNSGGAQGNGSGSDQGNGWSGNGHIRLHMHNRNNNYSNNHIRLHIHNNNSNPAVAHHGQRG